MKKIVIVGAFILIVCVFTMVFLCIPSVEQVNEELPAIILSKETWEIDQASVEIRGQWSKGKITKDVLTFSGQFSVDDLQSTMNNNWEIDVKLSAVEGTRYLRGFLPYKSEKGNLESAVLYVDADHHVYVYYDADYIVFSPANNEDEARMICKKLGLAFPE